MLFIDITEFRQIQPEKEVDIFQYYKFIQIFLGLRGRKSCNKIYSQESILMSVLQDDALVLEIKENYQNNANHGGVQQIQQYAQGLRCALAEPLSGLERYALCGSLIYDSKLYRCRRHLFATGNNSIKNAFCCYMYLPKFSPLASMFVWRFVCLFLFVCNVDDNSRMIWAIITNLDPSGKLKFVTTSKWRRFWKCQNNKHTFNFISNMKRSFKIRPDMNNIFYGDDITEWTQCRPIYSFINEIRTFW